MNIPEINYELLSETNEFLEKLDAFNLFYGSDIQVTKKARWKPGTYNKFKDIGVHQAFRNFHNGSGRTIRKLLYFHDYSLSTMKDKLLKMDRKLWHFRRDNVCFGESLEEGKQHFEEILANLTNSTNFNGEWEISNIPFYFMPLREDTRGTKLTDYESLGLMPRWFSNKSELFTTFDRKDTISPFDVKQQMSIINNYDATHPKWIFLNASIPLVNLNIKVTKRKTDMGTIPFGDMYFHICVSLKTLMKSYRRIRNTKGNNHISLSHRNFRGMVDCLSDDRLILRHPYVTAHRPTRSYARQYGEYGMGNFCLGNYEPEFLAHLSSGRLNNVEALLYDWAQHYPYDNINPLNRIHYSMYGKPKDFSDKVITQPAFDICQNKADKISIDVFEKTYCIDKCAFENNCSNREIWTSMKLTEKEINALENYFCENVRRRTFYHSGLNKVRINTIYGRYRKLDIKYSNLIHKTTRVGLEGFEGCIKEYQVNFGSRVLELFKVDNMGINQLINEDGYISLSQYTYDFPKGSESDITERFITFWEYSKRIWRCYRTYELLTNQGHSSDEVVKTMEKCSSYEELVKLYDAQMFTATGRSNKHIFIKHVLGGTE